jgi:hypothetical protein
VTIWPVDCAACQRPKHLAAGLPGWLSLVRIFFRYCAVLYGQNQATSALAGSGMHRRRGVRKDHDR